MKEMKETATVTAAALPVVRVEASKLALARQVDQIARGAVELFRDAGSFESELQVAQSMVDLRAALTDDMMRPVMGLMNSDLGFRTDRDPAVTPLDREGKPMTSYSVDVVRECFIESKLRGFHSVGNEWNIIAKRFYAARNGLKRQCERHPGVTDLRTSFGVPRVAGDKGAVVPVVATWKKDGLADRIEAEIPVRVNGGMGVDAIIGKAERKLFKRIADRLTGVYTPDGDIEDAEDVAVGSDAAIATAPKFNTSAATTINVASTMVPDAPVAGGTAPTSVPVEQTPQNRLSELCGASGFTVEDFKGWGKQSGQVTVADLDKIKAFDDVPTGVAARCLRSVDGFTRGVTAFKSAKGGSNA